MEDYALDVMIGKGPSARSLRLSLKPFTVVGATTRAGRISSPLRDRFGRRTASTSTRRPSSPTIVDRSARILGIEIDDAARSRSRGAGGARRGSSTGCSSGSATTPRSSATGRSTSPRRSRRCAASRSTTPASTRPTASCSPRSSRSSPSGPVGVAALAAVLREEIETIEDVYEPYLLRLGFLDRTPQGRIATEAARAHLAGSATRSRRRGARSRRSCRSGTSRARAAGARDRRRGAVARPRRSRSSPPPPADGGTRARLGRLTLPHGVVETPLFMPVGTNATVKALDPDDLARSRARRSSSPTPTTSSCARATSGSRGSAGCTGSWAGTGRSSPTRAASRSSASATCATIDEDGATFRSHLDGSTHRLHAGARDRGPGGARRGHRGRLRPARAAHASPRAGRRGRDRAHASLGGALARGARRGRTRRCSAIIQGGLEPDLRAASTRFIAALPFDGLCIGGLAGDETPAQRRRRSTSCAAPRRRSAAALPDGPRLAAGPARRRATAGVDLFDSVLPARVARNGTLWVPGRPAQPAQRALPRRPGAGPGGLPCRALPPFSRAYLAHLFRADELLAYRLATCHNLTFTLDFMARIRAASPPGPSPTSCASCAAVPRRAGPTSASATVAAWRRRPA